MEPYVELEERDGFIRARFLFARGGRDRPITHDYRCDWDIGNVDDDGTPTINGGPVILEDVDELGPGEQTIVRIHPMAPEFWKHVRAGMTINAHEGDRVVGSAEVLEIVPPGAKR